LVDEIPPTKKPAQIWPVSLCFELRNRLKVLLFGAQRRHGCILAINLSDLPRPEEPDFSRFRALEILGWNMSPFWARPEFSGLIFLFFEFTLGIFRDFEHCHYGQGDKTPATTPKAR
jgi:hypothetical protein